MLRNNGDRDPAIARWRVRSGLSALSMADDAESCATRRRRAALARNPGKDEDEGTIRVHGRLAS